MTEKNPLIGPHEGRELELMLKGEKPVAMFYEVVDHDKGLDLIPEKEFQPYVDSGKFIKKEITVPSKNNDYKIRYVFYSQQDKLTYLDRLITIKETVYDSDCIAKWSDEIEHEIGFLLGYSKEAVDAFLEHVKSRKKN